MKIVKFFKDDSYFKDLFYLALSDKELDTGYWHWGMGEDGDLYCRCSDFEDPTEWYPATGQLLEKLSIKYMKKIVDNFGHLLVFL